METTNTHREEKNVAAETKKPDKKPRQSREERLAQQLRENLRRRKEQLRQRNI